MSSRKERKTSEGGKDLNWKELKEDFMKQVIDKKEKAVLKEKLRKREIHWKKTRILKEESKDDGGKKRHAN